MLTIQEIKNKLTLDDIKKLVDMLGGNIHENSSKETIYNTICHSGHSHKLYLYTENKNFYCYSECGSFDIIELVRKVKEYSIPEAINWICVQLGFSTIQYGFGNQTRIDDWDFINTIRSRKLKKENEQNSKEEIKVYDEQILNIFQEMYLKEWINEGISVDAMKKYEILYNTLKQKIIIPHRNYLGELIGVRCRNTDDDEIENFGKYTPFNLWGDSWNHPLGKNLYGIHLNSESIKRNRKLMIVESEKSVLKCELFGNNNFTLAICGHSMSNYQRDLIINLGVRETIIALDKQWLVKGDAEYVKWEKHIYENIIKKLKPYVTVTLLRDDDGLLGYKDSPVDRGLNTLLHLMDKKIYV
jgi:hypothetical protein